MVDLLDDLRARGLVHDHTDEAGRREVLELGPVTLYCGMDTSADSLHVGHLIVVLVLRRVVGLCGRSLTIQTPNSPSDPRVRRGELPNSGRDQLAPMSG